MLIVRDNDGENKYYSLDPRSSNFLEMYDYDREGDYTELYDFQPYDTLLHNTEWHLASKGYSLRLV